MFSSFQISSDDLLISCPGFEKKKKTFLLVILFLFGRQYIQLDESSWVYLPITNHTQSSTKHPVACSQFM